MKKPILWLLLSDLERPDLALVLPCLAWMAQDAGALFECYGEARRDGRLFARTGSTVLGGAHHQAFNYLHASCEVGAIVWGETGLFDSSLSMFQTPVLARTSSISELYRTLLKVEGVGCPQQIVLAPEGPVQAGDARLEIAPYLFPDIFFGRALAFPAAQMEQAASMQEVPLRTLLLSPEAEETARQKWTNLEPIDAIREGDDFGSISLRVANRWKQKAKGVVFGDPPAVLSQMASHCRNRRVAVYAPKIPLAPAHVVVSQYTESTSRIAEETARLAEEIGNRVMVGRQTGDGDLFAWSKRGVCLQIVDPNRPAFPVVEALPHVWASNGSNSENNWWSEEPDDAQLEKWADEGRVLSGLLWHSGEVAHNEAMLQLFDLACWSGVKMGIGVHAQRYETAPQTWEMLSVSRERGGVRGLIEPVLHSGGLGVLAECNCPPELLRAHCEEALKRIRALAGEAGVPRGYYAFMDSDLATLTTKRPDVWQAVADSGLEYLVSSASPGRPRVLWQSENCLAINQSPRVIHGSSPFVRLTTAEELATTGTVRPGWILGTLDAPVIAFNPYIWRHGTRFMQLVEALQSGGRINVLPHTIARYARILKEKGLLPE